MLEAYGADVIYTDPLEGSDGAIREAHRRYKTDPEKYFMPDQYNNPANWQAHYDTTGPEIIEQTRVASPISWPELAPAAPSWGQGVDCVNSMPRFKSWRSSRPRICMASKGSTHGDRHCPRHLG
jgi:hypothetical protein